MTIQMELREILLLLLAFLGFVFTAGRLLLAQIDHRLDGRFAAMEEARKAGQSHWDKQFAGLAEQNRREAEGWQRLERDFLGWKAELPVQYVRREDYVRNQTVIEAKLDGLRLSIENQYLKGKHND
jgi:hypothetical protein